MIQTVAALPLTPVNPDADFGGDSVAIAKKEKLKVIVTLAIFCFRSNFVFPKPFN